MLSNLVVKHVFVFVLNIKISKRELFDMLILKYIYEERQQEQHQQQQQGKTKYIQ